MSPEVCSYRKSSKAKLRVHAPYVFDADALLARIGPAATPTQPAASAARQQGRLRLGLDGTNGMSHNNQHLRTECLGRRSDVASGRPSKKGMTEERAKNCETI